VARFTKDASSEHWLSDWKCFPKLWGIYFTSTVPELLVMLPEVAVILVLPEIDPDLATHNPPLSIVAMDVSDDAQVTELVMVVVVPSARCPIAVNCCDWDGDNDTLVGVTEMEVKADVTTATVVEPVVPLSVALMVADPDATPVTRPVALTDATEASEEDQDASSVTDDLASLS
jgi:hypothetical protein